MRVSFFVMATLVGSGMVLTQAAEAQRLPSVGQILGGRQASSSNQSNSAPGNNRELLNEFMTESQGLITVIDTTTTTEADNQRVDREVTAYRQRADRFASGRYDAVPEAQRNGMMQGLRNHFTGAARSTDQIIQFSQSLVSGIGQGNAAYNYLIAHDAYLYGAEQIFPNDSSFSAARSRLQTAIAAVGGSRASARGVDEAAARRALEAVRMPAAVTNDPGVESLFRQAWQSSGLPGTILRINITSGWTDVIEYGRVVGQNRSAVFGTRDARDPSRCNMVSFNMRRDSGGGVRRSSHTSEEILCENIPG